MRMDVSGTLLLIAGVALIAFIAWQTTEHNELELAFIGTLISFMAWLCIISGAKSLWLVYQDKKARRKADEGKPSS